MPPWWFEDDYYREALAIQNREMFQSFIRGRSRPGQRLGRGHHITTPTRRGTRGYGAGGSPG